MPKAKPLSKEQILAAQAKTKSNMAAARYLHVSYQHYKKWAKLYKLFDSHKNQSGKGIPKFLRGPKKMPHMLEIIEGRIAASSFDPAKLKYALIEQGYLLEECAVCSFKERRVLDYKMPLLLHFKDNNSNNYSLDNVQLLCYNHYFLTVGDIFNDKDIKQMESKQEHFGTTDKIEWEVDDYHLQRLKELGLDDEEDVNQYISRI
jgi:transposase|tara:strand:+ start:798 stop:1409 length:612 start_codon:yes stop_codon:yes gene_type:complete